MSRPTEVPPPLTCGACGALVDECQAWRPWPQRVPDAGGDFMILLPLLGVEVCLYIARWDPARARWTFHDDMFGVEECEPLAWRHLPPLPEWIA